MLRRLAVLLVCQFALAASAETRAAFSCLHVLVKTGETLAKQRAFWNRTEPITVMTPQGPKPFAFGWDAELWHVEDVIRIVRADREALEMARRKLDAKAKYLPTELAKLLQLDSVNNLREHLVANARDRDKLTLLDVKPASLSRLNNDASVKAQYANLLFGAVRLSMKNRDTGAGVKKEGSSGSGNQGTMGGGEALELIMRGALASPAAFRDNVKRLYADAKHPETHFHLSIPSSAATPVQVMLAARAMEMKIILEEAAADLEYDGTMAPYDSTVFARSLKSIRANYYQPNLPTNDRGAVRISKERWKRPTVAHDVEFRQWLDEDNALDNVRFMMELIQNADRLRDTSRFTGTRRTNQNPANFANSLRYAALVLEDRIPESDRHLIEKLRSFGSYVAQRTHIPDDRRREIGAFLRDHKILKRITLETFLEKPGAE